MRGAFVRHAFGFLAAAALTLAACNTPDVSAPASDEHAIGPAAARVTLIEYGDYQCPPCRNTHIQLQTLLRKYPNDLRVVFRHFPTRRHQNARIAAEAAEAAEAQGKFWEMHGKLFERQQEWYGASDPRPAFTRYAGEIGLDQSAFAEALRTHRFRRRVTESHERARTVGVRGAPAFFINGDRILRPPLTLEALEAAVAEALKLP